MADEQDIKIAILQHEVVRLREQHSIHKEEITQALREVADTFSENAKEIHRDIRSIYEFINRSKGGMAVLLLSASSLGGVVVAVVSWGLTRFIH